MNAIITAAQILPASDRFTQNAGTLAKIIYQAGGGNSVQALEIAFQLTTMLPNAISQIICAGLVKGKPLSMLSEESGYPLPKLSRLLFANLAASAVQYICRLTPEDYWRKIGILFECTGALRKALGITSLSENIRNAATLRAYRAQIEQGIKNSADAVSIISIAYGISPAEMNECPGVIKARQAQELADLAPIDYGEPPQREVRNRIRRFVHPTGVKIPPEEGENNADNAPDEIVDLARKMREAIKPPPGEYAFPIPEGIEIVIQNNTLQIRGTRTEVYAFAKEILREVKQRNKKKEAK